MQNLFFKWGEYFLSYENLKKFIKERALRGEKPETLREGLILNGWNQKDVDKAISEVYNNKKKIIKTFLLIIILFIIIVSISLLLIFKNYWNISSNNDLDGQKEIYQKNTDSCELVNYSMKEDCYLKKIEKGFNCENLIEEELFLCNRALDFFMLETFEY